MPSKNTKVQCPHCSNLIIFTKDKRGRWVGRVVGGVGGGWMGSSLGIAGAVLGISVGIAATIPLAIVGYFAGDRIGEMFSKVKCPECGKGIK